MTAKTTIQALLEVVKEGSKPNFLRFLNSSAILTVSPDYIFPKDVAILVYSFATLRIFDDPYWRVLESHFHYKRDEMNAHDFASCVWGFSKHPKQFQRSTWRSLEEGVRKNLLNFTPKELANICYSFAYRDYYSKPLWDNLKYAIMRQLNYINPIDIPLVIWAFSKASVDDANLWAIFEKKVFLEFKHFNAVAQGTIMYAFAKQYKGSEALWDLFKKTVFENIDTFGSKGMMNITWSFNRMGKGEDKLWNELISMLKNDMGNYQVNDAINSLCSIGQSFGMRKDFLEMIEGDLNSEEKLQKMTYGNIVKLIKLLCSNKIYKHEIWDQLAVRMRQLIQDVSYFNFRTHNCFLTVDSAFWNFFCEESFLLHFERSARATENRDSNVWVDTQIDIIDAGFFALYKALGSQNYWHELGKYLAQRTDIIDKLTPLQTAKFLHLMTKRFWKVSALKKQWLASEERICKDDEYFQKFMEQPKNLVIILRSALATDHPEHILKRFEQVYEAILSREDRPVDTIVKLIVEKRRKDNSRENKSFKKHFEKNIKEYNKEQRVELSKGVLEELFNEHLGTKYPPRPVYQEFMEKVLFKKENAVKEEKEEIEEHDNEDIKDLIEVELMPTQEEVKDPIDELVDPLGNSMQDEENKELIRRQQIEM